MKRRAIDEARFWSRPCVGNDAIGDVNCLCGNRLHAQHKEDIAPEEFIKYCLSPAKEMRAIIKRQLCIVDPKEFDVPGKNTIPDVQYKE